MLSTKFKNIAKPLLSSQSRGFAKHYFMVNYTYNEDAYYKRIPHREAHEKELKNLKSQNGGTTKILAAPHFPYDANTLIIECDIPRSTDGTEAFEQVQEFVKKDPYV